MNANKLPPKLDIKHAAPSALHLTGQNALSNYERLLQETQGLGAENLVNWSAEVARLEDPAGQTTESLYLTIHTVMPLTCQRCLGPVDVAVAIDRRFRFVDTEAQADEQDDESEEDLLVTSREFDLASLIEDEVLMDLPLVPRHDTCPVAVKLAVADADFAVPTEKPNPFAQLAQLKGKTTG